MTNKEFFELYAGQMIEYVYKGIGSALTTGKLYRLCGYDVSGVFLLVETPDEEHNTLKPYKDGWGTWEFLPDLPEDWQGIHCYLRNWAPPARDPNASICCRCGDPYKSKKEHRKVCK